MKNIILEKGKLYMLCEGPFRHRLYTHELGNYESAGYGEYRTLMLGDIFLVIDKKAEYLVLYKDTKYWLGISGPLSVMELG